jgi:V/A-type H+-transporting ATPase subunit E
MPNEKAQEALAGEIVEDARKRAERATARAKAEIEKIKAAAKAEADAEAEKIRADADRRAKRRAEMIVRTVDQEVARRKLRAREAVVQQVVDEAGKQLDGISGDEYQRSLVRLATAATRPCRAPPRP